MNQGRPLSPRNWPLAFKLASAVFILALVPMLLVGVLTARAVESESVRRETEGLRRRTAEASRRLEERLSGLRANAGLLANNPNLRDAVRGSPSVPPGDPAGNPAHIQAARSWDRAHPEVHDLLVSVEGANRWFEHVYLLDASGVCIASSDRAKKPDMVGRIYDFRPYFRTPIATGHAFVSDVFKNVNSPGTAMFVSAPVVVAGRVAAVVVLKVESETLHEVVTDLSELGGRALLVDRFGVVMSDSVTGKHLRVDDEGSLAFHALSPFVNEIALFEETMRYGDPEGENYLDRVQESLDLQALWSALADQTSGAREFVFPTAPARPTEPAMVGFAPVWSGEEEPYGYLVLAEASAHFREPLEALSRAAIWRFVLLVGGIALVMTVFIHRLSRRIGRLAEATRLVADGDLGRRLHDRSGDELGQLAGSFDRMTGQLAETMRILQEQREQAQQAKTEAVQANSARGTFMARFGEEFRIPLEQALVSIDVLRVEHGHSPDTVATLTRLRRAIEGVLGLGDEMLVISEADVSALELTEEAFELRPLLESAVARVRPIAALGSTTLELHVTEELGQIRTDRRKLNRIVLHLLENACKFTRKGSVTLEARRYGTGETAGIELQIRDTGIGLTRRQIEQMSSGPVRPVPAHDDVSVGAGFGLVVSRAFTQLLGGDLTVTSELGKGSIFTFSLPSR